MKQRSPAEVERALERYRQVVERYAGTLDLMSMGGLERLDEHLGDALVYRDVIADLSPAPVRVLDVGSGAGLPAIAIAASLPEVHVELIERRRRRVAFLSMAVATVGSGRAEVRSGDVREAVGPPADVVTAQAVGRFREVYELTRHRHARSVTVLSRKGPAWRDEADELAAATGAVVEVVAELPLARRGTLVAVRLPGGMPCRSSG